MTSYFKSKGLIIIKPKQSQTSTVKMQYSISKMHSLSFWFTPSILDHFFCPDLGSTNSLSFRLRLAPAHCPCCPWWLFHCTGIPKTAGVICCNWCELSPIASHWLSSWCQAPTVNEVVFLPIAFHGLSQCQAPVTLHNPFIFSKPVPPGDPYFTKFDHQHEV